MLAPSLIQRSDDCVGMATPTFLPSPVAALAASAAASAAAAESAAAAVVSAAAAAVVAAASCEPPHPVNSEAAIAVPSIMLKIFRFICYLPWFNLYIQLVYMFTSLYFR